MSHPVLNLLTKEQTAELFEACLTYLEVPDIEAALRRGLNDHERRVLAYQLSIEFDLEESGYRSS